MGVSTDRYNIPCIPDFYLLFPVKQPVVLAFIKVSACYDRITNDIGYAKNCQIA
jgi:hypothetical protein